MLKALKLVLFINQGINKDNGHINSNSHFILHFQSIQTFFDTTATVIIPARNQAINGQCTKKNASCKGAEIRDSRYNDMKTSMYLLGNAFRFNQQKPPDSLPTVKAAKAFFKEM